MSARSWRSSTPTSRQRIAIEEPISELMERFDLVVDVFPADAWRVTARLPPIHRDPVDRMLIAHALVKGMTLLTADANIRRYPVPFA